MIGGTILELSSDLVLLCAGLDSMLADPPTQPPPPLPPTTTVALTCPVTRPTGVPCGQVQPCLLTLALDMLLLSPSREEGWAGQERAAAADHLSTRSSCACSCSSPKGAPCCQPGWPGLRACQRMQAL